MPAGATAVLGAAAIDVILRFPDLASSAADALSRLGKVLSRSSANFGDSWVRDARRNAAAAYVERDRAARKAASAQAAADRAQAASARAAARAQVAAQAQAAQAYASRLARQRAQTVYASAATRVQNRVQAAQQAVGASTSPAQQRAAQANLARVRAQARADIAAAQAAVNSAVRAANAAQSRSARSAADAALDAQKRLNAALAAQRALIDANAAAYDAQAAASRAAAAAGAKAAVVAASRIGLGIAGAGLRAVGDLTSAFGRFLANARAAVLGAFDSVSGTIRGIAGMALGAFNRAGGIRGLAENSIDLESAKIRLGRSTGLSGGALGAADEKIRRIGTMMPGASLMDVYGAASQGARLGVKNQDLELYTRDLVKLQSVLEGIPIEHAATEVAQLQNVFKLGRSSTLGIASALNYLDLQSTASAADILQMTAASSGVASSLKMTLPQLMALTTGMREAGVTASVGATAISTLATRMAGSRQAGFARIAGMSRREFSGLIDKSPFEAIQAIYRGMEAMRPQEKVKALEDLRLHGRMTAGSITQLGQVFRKLDGFAAGATEQMRTGASIQESYAAVAEGTRAQLQKLANQFSDAADRLGRHLLPFIKGASKGLGTLASDVGAYLEANKDTLAGWADWVAEKVALAGVAFREFPLFVSLGKALAEEKLKQVQAVFSRFSAGIMANLRWAGGVVANVFGDFGAVLAKWFWSLGRRLAEEMINGLVDMLPDAATKFLGIARITEDAMTSIRLDVGKIDPFRGLGKAPGFGDLFGNLPQQKARIDLIISDIEQARKRADAAAGKARLEAEAQDAATRAKEARSRALASLDRVRVAARPEGPQSRSSREFNAAARAERDRVNEMMNPGGARRRQRRADEQRERLRRAAAEGDRRRQAEAGERLAKAVREGLESSPTGRAIAGAVQRIAQEGIAGVFGP